MPELADVLRTLPPKGIRLKGGLALHLERGTHGGMNTLTLSRIAQPPSQTEVETVAAAVFEAYRPTLILVDDKPHSRLISGRRHDIRRLYWRSDGVQLLRPEPAKEIAQPDIA